MLNQNIMHHLSREQWTVITIIVLVAIFAVGVVLVKDSTKPQQADQPPSEQPAVQEDPVPSLTTGSNLPDIQQDLEKLELNSLESELEQEIQDMETQLQQLE